MSRIGIYIRQASGYKALMPANLPPDPPLKIDKPLQILLSGADMVLAKLDGVGYTLYNYLQFFTILLQNRQDFYKILS